MRRDEPERIGDRLVEAGVINEAQRDVTLQQQRLLQTLGRAVRFGEQLVANRFADSATIDKVLARSSTDLHERGQDEPLIAPADCVRWRIQAVDVVGGVLTVKAARPLSETERNNILRVCAVPATQVRVRLVDRHEMHKHLAQQRQHDSFAVVVERLRTSDPSPALLKAAIDALLHEAIDRRASDVHIDVKPDPYSWIVLRIDSHMRPAYALSERTMAAIVTRLKTLAGMDASSRKAQDGALRVEHRGRMVEVRMATQSLDGDSETLTMRIRDDAALPTAQSLFPHQPEMVALIHRIAHRRGKVGGFVLVTGATGSGKSTTMLALAAQIPLSRNILTVEDPIEGRLPFGRQIQLQQLLGENVMDLERSLLRQDPDVIIVGEIRDADTAMAALRFAEGGHLVVATLHAKTPTQSVERLLAMIPANERSEAASVLGATLLAVINQRLADRLCGCAKPLDAAAGEAADFHRLARRIGVVTPDALRRTAGCPRCEHAGYRGRVALHETCIIDVDEETREAVSRRIASGEHARLLLEAPDVRLIRRRVVAARLLEAGLIDVPTALAAVDLPQTEAISTADEAFGAMQ